MKTARHSAMAILTLILGLALMGCCSNPGVFDKINSNVKKVQTYYDPLVAKVQNATGSGKVAPVAAIAKEALVASDTVLLLAGELQTMNCPPEGKVEQLDLQTEQAVDKAAQVVPVAEVKAEAPAEPAPAPEPVAPPIDAPVEAQAGLEG